MKRLFFILLVLFLLTGCGDGIESSKIRIFTDSSITEAVNAVIESYKEENLVDIEVVSNSTSRLLSKIEDGADCDIFIPSSKDSINTLEGEKLVNRENVTPILTNNVVLISGYKSGTTVKSFDTVTEAANIALAREKEPLGAFSREILINLNVYKQVLGMKISTLEDSPSVVEAVAQGKNEVGICFESDALANADRVNIITRPPRDALNSEVIYSVAVINRDDGLEPSNTVKDIAAYLDTPEAARIFARYELGIYIN